MNRANDSNESPAPPRLISALRQTQSARVFVPPAADEAVLRAARNHFAPPRLRGLNAFIRRFLWPAFAAACVLLCAVAYRLTRPDWSPNPVQRYAREDVNRDGRVDILDAFQLARQLRSGDKLEPHLDLNGDGLVDHRDADTIAAQAVKLERGRS